MGGSKAVELRHDGKTYRAANRDVFFQWAREHRISIDDSYRVAGTEKWIPVTANNELNALLDPENWWKVKMGGKTYVAFDWDSIVRWAKEGRLSIDVQIEGPKTPPGGILGKASPELSPYLREWVPDDPKKKPVRLRFDGRTFVPGNVDTLKKWIQESRVPVEAEVSIQGEEWQSVSGCGYFEKELWPSEVSIIKALEAEERTDPEPPRADVPEEPPESGPPEPDSSDADGSTEETGEPDSGHRELYRITTTYGEDYSFEAPEEVLTLLKRKRVNGFDEIKHPDLADGTMFVSEFVKEYLPAGRFSILLIVLAVIFGIAGAAALVFQQQNAQWMLIGGIASLAIALILVVRIIWKK